MKNKIMPLHFIVNFLLLTLFKHNFNSPLCLCTWTRSLPDSFWGLNNNERMYIIWIHWKYIQTKKKINFHVIYFEWIKNTHKNVHIISVTNLPTTGYPAK